MALDPSKLLSFLGGGSRARSSSSSSLNAVISPNISISTAGPATGSAGGTASGSATSDASGSDSLPGFLPTGGFGPALPPPSFDIDGPAVAPVSAGAGLFDSPLLLMGLAVGGFLLFSKGGK